MNTLTVNVPQQPTTPSAPQLPQLGDPQFADRMRLYEAWQRERNIVALDRLAAANEEVARVAVRQVTAMERLLTDGPGTDTTMNAALKDIAEAIRGRAGSGALPSSDEAALVLLMSTLTSAKRESPVAAAQACAAQLAAIRAL